MTESAVQYIIGPNGDPVALQAHQVADAMGPGVTPISGEVARALEGGRQDNAWADELGTAGKAAAGFAGGLTLGMGPAAAEYMGLVGKHHLEALQNTGAYTAGDVAGTIAPALLTGGESLVGRGVIGKALRFGTPAGLMGEAGGAAERLAGKFLGEAGILGKGASSTIQMASRGATEGAIINAAHQASDDIIQNKPLAAQSLLAAGADGALFGGLTGGLLGGATAALGAGIEGVSGRVATSAGGKGEDAAVKALKYMGQSDAKLAEITAKEGSVVPHLRAMQEVLTDGEGSIATKTSEINRVARAQVGKYTEIANDAVEQLQREAPGMTPKFTRMDARMVQDVASQYEGTLNQKAAKGVLMEARKDLAKLKTWENWASSREMLADRMNAATGIRQDVYKTALNAFDSELRVAMEEVNPELAKQFGAAVSSRRMAQELADMSGVKAIADQGKRGIHLDNSDAGTVGYALMTGANPIVGAGILAAKKLAMHVANRMEPVVAEYAARSALGASAGAAQATMRTTVRSTMKRFLTGGRQAASELKASKPDFSMKGYESALKLADDLTSAAHQAKVRETMAALEEAGHGDLANEMGLAYGRAVAYTNATKPKGRSKESAAGRLGKTPKDAGISTDGMKFVNRLHAMRDPIGALMGGLENGNISRDAVAAVKYVYPDVHKEIVMIASQQVMEMKAEGKFLPADKIALFGTALDAPIDTTLNPEFIAEIQKAHAANNAPPPENGDVPPPQTDITPYQTPLQSSV